jgi:hypothetical protein
MSTVTKQNVASDERRKDGSYQWFKLILKVISEKWRRHHLSIAVKLFVEKAFPLQKHQIYIRSHHIFSFTQINPNFANVEKNFWYFLSQKEKKKDEKEKWEGKRNYIKNVIKFLKENDDNILSTVGCGSSLKELEGIPWSICRIAEVTINTAPHQRPPYQRA